MSGTTARSQIPPNDTSFAEMSPSEKKRPAARPSAAARARRVRSALSATATAAAAAIQTTGAPPPGGGGVGGDPDDGARTTRGVRSRRGADQREGEQQEAEQGDPDGELLARREPPRVAARAERGEDGDAARAHSLDEAERGQREGGKGDEPAGGLSAEADQPVAASEEQRQRAERPPRGERRERGRRVVLLRVGPVHRQRRRERQAEP